MYHTLYEKFSSDNGKTPPSFGVKLSIGLASGAVGAFVGTPSEVALIRMTSDGNAPPSQVTLGSGYQTQNLVKDMMKIAYCWVVFMAF